VFSLSQFEASLRQATDSCRSVSSTCYEPGVPLLADWARSGKNPALRFTASCATTFGLPA